ncbi:hypothetical protein [Thermoflavimicrobium daqui]|uniref:Uncharacterized protein n=1 Tax=Thermoflavimicrobium daqui TaxID=2137476 RepID=A0A364K9H8_9BACL|nr:hypothetical protein [Thermoflavimicrobium daqui]RAL26949.1 hypothetical protein DL897_02585 [Thermoflavimicrobium daqui]
MTRSSFPTNYDSTKIDLIKNHPLQNSLLKKFLTKPKITNYYSFIKVNNLFYSKTELIEQIRLLNRAKRFDYLDLSPLPMGYQIQFEYHAIKRWNERISTPILPQQLQLLLQQIYFMGRIKISKDGWGFIDQDILLGYRCKKDTFIIQTFLGRTSLVPHLANYPSLLRFNQIQKDRINLRIPTRILHRQKLPLIPREILCFQGDYQKYQLEEYTYHNNHQTNGTLYLITIKPLKKDFQTPPIRKIIDIDNPYIPMLTRKILYILYKKGHKDFISRHVIFNKPEKVGRLLAKSSSFFLK